MSQAQASGLSFPTIFGNNTSDAKSDKAPAQFWLNVGYEIKDPVTGEMRFVSLPVGIALDNMTHLATNSKNESFARLQQARNGLLDQLVELGKTLKPGEAKILTQGSVLAIQLRRVNADAPELPTDGNPFAIKLAL